MARSTKPERTERKHEHSEALLDRISKWMQRELLTPEFRAFKRKQMANRLFFDDPFYESDGLDDFPMSGDLERRHAFVTSYFALRQGQFLLEQCQYYFRRYPFARMPVSRADHLRNVCEMYFGAFYIIRSRLKNMLNLLNAVSDEKLDVGVTLKWFDKTFDAELRERNKVHHSQPFDDIVLERLTITELIASRPNDLGWSDEHLRHYRRASAEWARRAKRRSVAIDDMIDALSKAIMETAKFLEPPQAITEPEST